MSRYSKEDILRLVAEEDVEFVRLQFTDAFGILKNVAITSSQLKRALDNKNMFADLRRLGAAKAYTERVLRIQLKKIYL